MSSVTSWVSIICLCAVSASVLNMMTPSGNMNRIFKYILGVFLICSVIIPISQLSTEDFAIDDSIFDIDTENYGSDSLNEIKTDYLSDSVVSLIENELDSISVKPIQTQIFMDTSKEDSISITKAVITVKEDDAQNKQNIIQLLKNNLGIDAEVYIKEDNNE